MAKKRKGVRHLPQRRGRALKPGPRYASGKRKPDVIGPNPEVLTLRRLLLNAPNAKLAELRPAENPLDLALARGWISPSEHAAGVLLADTFARSGIDLPKLRTQDLAREVRGGETVSGDPKAMDKLRAVGLALRSWPKSTGAVMDLCILGEWPRWMVARINGTERADYEVGRVHLRVGLRIVAKVLGCESVGDQRRVG